MLMYRYGTIVPVSPIFKKNVDTPCAHVGRHSSGPSAHNIFFMKNPWKCWPSRRALSIITVRLMIMSHTEPVIRLPARTIWGR